MSLPSGIVTATFTQPSAASIASAEVDFPATNSSSATDADTFARVTLVLASTVRAGASLTLRIVGLVNSLLPRFTPSQVPVWTQTAEGAALDLFPSALFPVIILGEVLGATVDTDKAILVRSQANVLHVNFELATRLLPTDRVHVTLPMGLKLNQPGASVVTSLNLVSVSSEGRVVVMRANEGTALEDIRNLTLSVDNVQCTLTAPTFTVPVTVEVLGEGGSVKHAMTATAPLTVYAGSVESAWWESGAVMSGTDGHTLTMGFSPYSEFGPGDVLRVTLPPAMSLFAPGITNVDLLGDRGSLQLASISGNMLELVRPHGQLPLNRGTIRLALTNVAVADVPTGQGRLGNLKIELWGEGGMVPKDAAGAPGPGPSVFHTRMGLISASLIPRIIKAGAHSNCILHIDHLTSGLAPLDRVMLELPPGVTSAALFAGHPNLIFHTEETTTQQLLSQASGRFMPRTNGGLLVMTLTNGALPVGANLTLDIGGLVLPYPAAGVVAGLHAWTDGGESSLPKDLATLSDFPALSHPSCRLTPASYTEVDAAKGEVVLTVEVLGGSMAATLTQFPSPKMTFLRGLQAEGGSRFAGEVVSKFESEPDLLKGMFTQQGAFTSVRIGALPNFTLANSDEMVQVSLDYTLVSGAFHSMLCTGAVTIQDVAAGRVTAPAFPVLVGGQSSLVRLSLTTIPSAELTVTPSHEWLRFTPTSLSFGPLSPSSASLVVTVLPDAPNTPIAIVYVLSGPAASFFSVEEGGTVQVLQRAAIAVNISNGDDDVYPFETFPVVVELTDLPSALMLGLPLYSSLGVSFAVVPDPSYDFGIPSTTTIVTVSHINQYDPVTTPQCVTP
jgi:hypothetical protein